MLYVLLFMVFLHIVDDFHLQGCLKDLKQKVYWKEYVEKQSMYGYDYVAALVIHSFSWAFMIMLPLAYMQNFNVDILFVVVLLVNATVHGIIDHLKANLFKINLIQDQTAHLVQIIVTFLICVK